MVKSLFAVAYWCLLLVMLPISIWQVVSSSAWFWLGPLLVAAAPLCHRLLPYDRTHVPHHKVRLPRVSLLVLGGLALVLLLGEPGAALWWTLAGVGGFLLHTYWVRD